MEIRAGYWLAMMVLMGFGFSLFLELWLGFGDLELWLGSSGLCWTVGMLFLLILKTAVLKMVSLFKNHQLKQGNQLGETNDRQV